MAVQDLARELAERTRTPGEILSEVELSFATLLRDAEPIALLALLSTLREALPSSAGVYRLLSRAHEQLGDEEEAAQAEEHAQRLLLAARGGHRSVEETLLLARLLFAADNVSQADRLLKPLVRQEQQNLQLMKLWAQIKHTQGQLTEAIRAFEQVRLLAPRDESALLHLGIIHRLSQSPDAAKRELELVGDNALARRHLAQIELEKAFQLAARQQFTSAVDICTRLAERHRTTEPDLFKLALLEKAFLLEGIANYDSAVETLEQLGRERGFEEDHDRLRSLARIYELRAQGSDLARAQRVYSFLHQKTGAPEFLSRMARIAQRRGNEEESRRLEERFVKAFRREHQELTMAELLKAASTHYMPLRALAELVPEEKELTALSAAIEARLHPPAAVEGVPMRHDSTTSALEPDAGQSPSEQSASLRRKLALLLALLGRKEESAELWRELIATGQGLPIDSKYFGDLREALGDPSGARALYLSALSQEEVADSAVLSTVLASEDPEHARLLLGIFSDSIKRERTYEALKAAAKAQQLSPEAWWNLARFERLIGLLEQAQRHEAKAQALARTLEKPVPKIGHVQVAAVYELRGAKQGIIHQIWASRYRIPEGSRRDAGGQLDESSIFGNLAFDMMRDVQNVFVAVRAFVQEKFPHLVEDFDQYRYMLKVTKDDEPSGGNSAGIAVALAFVSVFLQLPVPQDFAITGSLVADSATEIRVRRVADIDAKVLGAYQRRLPRLIAPAENRADLEASHLVPREIWDRRVVFASSLTQVMKLVFGEDLWEI